MIQGLKTPSPKLKRFKPSKITILERKDAEFDGSTSLGLNCLEALEPQGFKDLELKGLTSQGFRAERSQDTNTGIAIAATTQGSLLLGWDSLSIPWNQQDGALLIPWNQ